MTIARDGTPALLESEFAAIQKLAHRRFGLWLRDGKQELVRTRLGKELRRLGVASFGEYTTLLERDASGELEEQFTNLLTTNHTHFFREAEHFRFLESKVLPDLAARASLDFWCAACATGEEAYTLAMCVAAFLKTPDPPMSILATDISTRALAVARRGVYDESRFSTVRPEALRPYLLRGRSEPNVYRIRPELRNRIRFEQLNLLGDWPVSRRFPVIFCRNVMIYFDRDTQSRVVNRLAERLEPGGYLFVGHSESLNGYNHPLTYVLPAVYRKGGSLSGGKKG